MLAVAITLPIAALLALGATLWGGSKVWETQIKQGTQREILGAQEAQFQRQGELAKEARGETRRAQAMLLEKLKQKTETERLEAKGRSVEETALQQAVSPASAQILLQGLMAQGQTGAITQGAIMRATRRLGL